MPVSPGGSGGGSSSGGSSSGGGSVTNSSRPAPPAPLDFGMGAQVDDSTEAELPAEPKVNQAINLIHQLQQKKINKQPEPATGITNWTNIIPNGVYHHWDKFQDNFVNKLNNSVTNVHQAKDEYDKCRAGDPTGNAPQTKAAEKKLQEAQENHNKIYEQVKEDSDIINSPPPTGFWANVQYSASKVMPLARQAKDNLAESAPGYVVKKLYQGASYVAGKVGEGVKKAGQSLNDYMKGEKPEAPKSSGPPSSGKP